jgi:hypothetical protein
MFSDLKAKADLNSDGKISIEDLISSGVSGLDQVNDAASNIFGSK